MDTMGVLPRVLLALLIAPWSAAGLLVRVLVFIVRLPRRLRMRTADALPCPMGHANAVYGRWGCGCGASYLGHAFGPCPVCSMPAGWIRCETCGLAIRSPWKID